MQLRALFIAAASLALLSACTPHKPEIPPNTPKVLTATQDDGSWFYIAPEDTAAGPHHLRHGEIYGKYVEGYNKPILSAIDTVQAHAPSGGGYFIGIKAIPTESPVGYRLALFGQPLLDPPRTTSYCSGSSYTAFIEALNVIYPDGASRISPDRAESLRMQEPGGGRREDSVKFWGHWNDDGPGTQYALVQYSGMGEEIAPKDARPGDFMNISWKSGLGHSVVFLGWTKNEGGETGVSFWSSQTSTEGYGDVHLKNLDKIESVKIVRLTHPERLFTFDVATPVNRKIPGDKIVPETVAANASN